MLNILDSMRLNPFQIFWACILIPLFITDAILQLKRGWKILKYDDYSLHWVVKFRIWLYKILQGEETSNRYYFDLIMVF
jgi:hypothetical protein